MKFPRHCHKPDGRFVSVTNQEQYDAVIANGWADQPLGHVERPVEVRYTDAIVGGKTPSSSSLVSDLTVPEASDLIATADAATLKAIEAEETAGKNRAGVCKAIDARKAELAG